MHTFPGITGLLLIINAEAHYLLRIFLTYAVAQLQYIESFEADFHENGKRRGRERQKYPKMGFRALLLPIVFKTVLALLDTSERKGTFF